MKFDISILIDYTIIFSYFNFLKGVIVIAKQVNVNMDLIVCHYIWLNAAGNQQIL